MEGGLGVVMFYPVKKELHLKICYNLCMSEQQDASNPPLDDVRYGPRTYLGGKAFRKRALDFSKSVSKERIQGETENPRWWDIRDSSLEGMFDKDSFQRTFEDVVPPNQPLLRRYIETTLADRRGSAIGIELGGPGSKLFSGFSKGFFERTLGVTLKEKRNPKRTLQDDLSHHFVREANLLDDESTAVIKNWLNGRKADVIIERMAGALSYGGTPVDPHFVLRRVSEWYKMLSVGGLMFLQIPEKMRPIMPMVMEKLSKVPELEVRYDPRASERPSQRDHMHHAVSIHKLSGAPDTIPLLDPRKIRELYVPMASADPSI